MNWQYLQAFFAICIPVLLNIQWLIEELTWIKQNETNTWIKLHIVVPNEFSGGARAKGSALKAFHAQPAAADSNLKGEA